MLYFLRMNKNLHESDTPKIQKPAYNFRSLLLRDQTKKNYFTTAKFLTFWTYPSTVIKAPITFLKLALPLNPKTCLIILAYSSVPNTVRGLNSMGGPKLPKSNSMGGANNMGEGESKFSKKISIPPYYYFFNGRALKKFSMGVYPA